MVFYFTATGNSLYAAKQLEKAPVSIAQAVHDLENVYEAEKIGIERVLTHFGVPATEENMQKYHHLNKSYWQ